MGARTAPYGPTVMDHFRRPRNEGRLSAPDAEREGANPLCGDRVRIQLALRDGCVREARFTANACAISIAAASLLTERARGMAVALVREIPEEEVLAELGPNIPQARRACAVLPLKTMQAALASVDRAAPESQSSPPG